MNVLVTETNPTFRLIYNLVRIYNKNTLFGAEESYIYIKCTACTFCDDLCEFFNV